MVRLTPVLSLNAAGALVAPPVVAERGAPARRSARRSGYRRPTPAVVDLPWIIPTPAGEVTVALAGDRYRISGPSGEHVLATEPWNTDRARLVAHVDGYVTSNGGTFTPPPGPIVPEPAPRRTSTAELFASVQAATRAAKAEARTWTLECGGVLRVQLATVHLVHADGRQTRTDVVEPAAIRGALLLRWRKAARTAGAVRLRVEGEIGWAESATAADTIPTGARWAVEVTA